MPFVNDRLADPGRPTAAGGSGLSLESARRRLEARIVGQDEAITAVVRVLALVRANIRSDGGRPWATVLLAGQTGIGKTELVRQTAAVLRSAPDDLCRIDMGGLAQEHYAASLSGAPPGYAGSKEGHSLFDRTTVEGDTLTPGIVLFDEIEKAHGVVLRSLLHVLDHGELRLANGQQRLRFHNTVVFMTSNLGARELDARLLRVARRASDRSGGVLPAGLSPHARAAIQRRERQLSGRAIRRFFDPEFLNRIDEVIHLNTLDSAAAGAVARLCVSDLQRLLDRRGIALEVQPEVIDHVVARGFDPAYGGRSVRRAVRTHVAMAVAQALAERDVALPKPSSLRVTLDHGRISVHV